MKNNKQSRILLHLNIIAVLISITFFSYIYYIVGKDAHAIYFALAALAFGFNIYLISRNQTKAVGILSILYSDMLVLIFDAGYRDNHNNAVVMYLPLLMFSYVVTLSLIHI